nr:transposase [Rhodococcus sp. WB9]
MESDSPLVGPLLTRRVNTELVAGHWDDLLRLAGSLKFGTRARRCWSGSFPRRAGRTPLPRR